MIRTYKLPINSPDEIDPSDIQRAMDRWITHWGWAGVLTANVFLDEESYTYLVESLETDCRLQLSSDGFLYTHGHLKITVQPGADLNCVITSVNDGGPIGPRNTGGIDHVRHHEDLVEQFSSFELK